ncbi:hypothetical protein UJ11_003574 [Salmonella enterica subsp. enterica]|nr:hypothetical protein [Salmonella enterica subsp. enterica serovar Baguida]
MSLLQSFETFMGFGDTAGQAGEVVNGVVNAIPSVEEMQRGVGAAVSNEPVGVSAGASVPGASHQKPWAGKALEPIMAKLVAASLITKRTPTAPIGGAGHGVQVNTSGYDSIMKGTEKIGNNDPLQGLSGFKNLL